MIGLAVAAPYLHDGGVAASAEALQQDKDGLQVIHADQLGMVGTLTRGIQPDAAASLRLLLDRRLREPMIAANRSNPDLQRSTVEGIGHAYWVDAAAGFTLQEQTDLIQFLLSLDDDPAVLPPSLFK